MFKVAVIQNESELLRSGYANVVQKLSTLVLLEDYEYESFTTVNIVELFQEGNNALKKYDSLFITTNATSDFMVLEVLRKNKKKISEFIESGKGIFIGSQKKLSKSAADLKVNTTGFMPEYYEFGTMQRSEKEWDSGKGNISEQSEVLPNVMLEYPQKISIDKVNNRCMDNEFRRHFYRSHLKPFSAGAYAPILVDASYSEDNYRMLLMYSQSPLNQERVVISTIALDWEFHKELLANIVKYITEGPPILAFIRKRGSTDGDYDYLLTSAQISKIPHVIYDDYRNVPEALKAIHVSYIFSPEWSEGDILVFVKLLKSTIKKKEKRENKRIYYFRNLGEMTTLNQISTYSSVDRMIDQVILWFESKYQGCMWNNGFWITHDILFMLTKEKTCDEYIEPILRDIKKHYKNKSYDGIMGATCGLLELTLLFHDINLKKCENIGFGIDKTHEMCKWIVEKYAIQSKGDRRTAFITLRKMLNAYKNKNEKMELKVNELEKDILEGIDDTIKNDEELSEMEICKIGDIICLCSPENAKDLKHFIVKLGKMQASNGLWGNVGRTAHVLIFLLGRINELKKIGNAADDVNIDNMIYKGILALRSAHNLNGANWDDDLQATANATRAISAYNKLFKYSTQDLLIMLKNESENINSSENSRSLGEAMSKIRVQINDMFNLNSSLEQINEENRRILLFEPIWRYAAFCTSVILFGVFAYLFMEQRAILKTIIREMGILNILLGMVIGLIAGIMISKWAGRVKGNVSKST